MASRDELSREVDQRTKTEKLLRESELKFRSLSDASFEGIIISEKGKILEVNSTISKFSGYSIDELISMSTTDLVTPEMREEVQQKILTGYDKPYEVRCLKKDGSAFAVEVHGKMFAYKGIQVRVTAVRDLTEQKKAEAEINALREILPICSFCKNIRNDEGYYEQIEGYIQKYSGVDFSHTICPTCLKKHYPAIAENLANK